MVAVLARREVRKGFIGSLELALAVVDGELRDLVACPEQDSADRCEDDTDQEEGREDGLGC